MNAVAFDGHDFVSSTHSQVPLYFPSGDSQLFGWLHNPAPQHGSSIGLVICKPFGYESICAYRSVRQFADAAAAIGVPALRFDYIGTGDSEDPDPGTEQIAAWTQDVLAAVRALQEHTGVNHVCLLGIRLGALLATLAAAQSEAVQALIVIAPIISGRRYLRELRTVQLAAPRIAVVTPTVDGHEETTAEPVPLEVSGFSMMPATVARLAQIDLMTSRQPPASRMLVIDRSDLPVARAWADAVSAGGAEKKYVCLPGIVEMVWTAPHFGAIPDVMIAATTDWIRELRDTLPSLPAVDAACEKMVLNRGSVKLRLADLHAGPQAALVERPVFFSVEPPLFGIVTEPRSGEMRRRAVILVNDGATNHVGANRMNVTLARRWARSGYVVLRMDLAGLGESPARLGRPDNEVFPVDALHDIGAAIDFLRSQFNARDVTVSGLCSGAYHSLRAAVGGLPVNRVFLINPENFNWKHGANLNDLQLVEVMRGPRKYRERMLSEKNWRRLLSGQVDVRRIVSVSIRRAWFTLKSTLRDVARNLRIRLPHDLGWELEGIVARGIQVVFVFARGEVGLDLLRIMAGSSINRLGDRCRVHVVDGADHIFSQSGPRRVLEDILSNELFTPSPVVRANQTGSGAARTASSC